MPPSDQDMLAALTGLRDVLGRCSTRSAALITGIDKLIEQHAAGQSWRDIAERTDGPTVMEQINDAITEVVEAAAVVRREAVQQLLDQGMTESQVAARFHISRQRVNQLARSARK